MIHNSAGISIWFRHTYPAAQRVRVQFRMKRRLVVYLRLRTVSITLTSTLFDVLEVVGGTGVSVLPSVGMSPAKIEVDSAHMSASAIANRFIVVAPLRLRNAESLT